MHFLTLRKVLVLVLACAGALVPTGSALAIAEPEVQVSKGAQPDWVLTQTLPTVPHSRHAQAGQGIITLLSDVQVSWRPGGYEFFHRVAYQVIDRSGLEAAARIEEQFDPHRETLQFHHINVSRAGELQAQLDDAEIAVLRQESSLEEGIIDGLLTALVILKDVAVGDVVDYAYSGSVTTELWPDHYFSFLALGSTLPIGAIHYRVLWPSAKPLHVKPYNKIPAAAIRSLGELTEYRWQVIDPEPIKAEAAVPPWYVAIDAASISTMDSWRAVKQWALPIYQLDQTLPAPFRKKLKTISRSWRRPEDRLTEVLRLVQNEIRYVGIEVGLGSHVPRPPAEVVQLGYGDCKDKSLLMVAALNQLGIQAWPALTHTSDGRGLPDRMPSVGAFNHVIVKAELNGRTYWLDPTLSHQGGRGENLSLANYGNALPIDDRAGGLEQITMALPAAPTFRVAEQFSFDADISQPVSLTATLEYQAGDADDRRINLAAMTSEQLNEDIRHYYQQLYADARIVTPVQVNDDLDSNRITETVSLTMSKNAAGQAIAEQGLGINAFAILDLFNQNHDGERQYPMLLPYPLNRQHQIRVQVPGRRIAFTDQKSEAAADASFERRMGSDEDVMTMDFTLRTTGQVVSADESQAAVDFARAVDGHGKMTVYVSKLPMSLASRLGLAPALVAPVESPLSEALSNIGAEEYTAAIAILNKLERQVTAQNRLRGYIQLLRGESLAKTNRYGAAEKALAEGLALYPDNAQAYFTLADLYHGQEKYADAARVLTALVKNLPDQVNGISWKYVQRLNRVLKTAGQSGVYDALVLALAKAGYVGSAGDQTDGLYFRAVELALAEQQTEWAGEIVRNIHHSELHLDLLADRQFASLWPVVEQYAGSDLGKSIDNYLAVTAQWVDQQPDDFSVLAAHAAALRAAGKHQEALAKIKPVLDDWDRITAEGQEAFWLANEVAYIHYEQGDVRKADQLLLKIKDLGLEDYPSTVSMMINHAIILLDSGKFRQALKATDAIDPDYVSDYGDMYIKQVQSCALRQLKKTREAEQVLADMASLSDTNVRAYAYALLCNERLDEYEALLVQRLQGKETRADALLSFAVAKPSRKLPELQGVLMKRAALVRQRPGVQTALAQYGRAVPVAGDEVYWYGY